MAEVTVRHRTQAVSLRRFIENYLCSALLKRNLVESGKSVGRSKATAGGARLYD